MTKKSKTNSWDLSPAPESTSHINLKGEYGLFINGKFHKSKKGKLYDTINPANEKKIAKITESTKEDVALAVNSAKKAYDNVWSKMPGAERGKYIYRIVSNCKNITRTSKRVCSY